MDNHRAALWAWLQEVQEGERYKLLHVDAHPDMSPKGLHCDCYIKTEFEGLSIEEYLEANHSCNGPLAYKTSEIVSYENFLRLFAQKYKSNIESKNIYITHKISEKKPEKTPDIHENLKNYLSDSKAFVDEDCSLVAKRLYKTDLVELLETNKDSNWIIDIDFDYFYNEKTKSIDLAFAKNIFTLLKKWLDEGIIVVISAAWSPEFLIDNKTSTIEKGLKRAKEINEIFCSIFDFKFKEPK